MGNMDIELSHMDNYVDEYFEASSIFQSDYLEHTGLTMVEIAPLATGPAQLSHFLIPSLEKTFKSVLDFRSLAFPRPGSPEN